MQGLKNKLAPPEKIWPRAFAYFGKYPPFALGLSFLIIPSFALERYKVAFAAASGDILVAKENERLSRMIDSFLTFSRMERNKKVFTIVDAKPAAIARDAAEAVRTKFATSNCNFTVETADNLPDVLADHDAMVTVLVNLLDNACKYTGDEKRITLKVFAENNNICLAVSDNGIGLTRRHIRRIFDSFYQVDNSLSRKAEGCGLGLSIVKFIVDAHKGTVVVDSKPGKGSTFTVKIPFSARSAD